MVSELGLLGAGAAGLMCALTAGARKVASGAAESLPLLQVPNLARVT